MNKKPILILLVEDDIDHVILTKKSLKQSKVDFQIDVATNSDECLEKLKKNSYNAIVLDYSLPKVDGLSLLGKINEKCYHTPVIMVTGQGDEMIAVEAMKKGAYDYVVKSQDYLVTLPLTIQRVIEKDQKQKYSLNNIIGESPLMRRLKEYIQKVVQIPQTTVLIQGETGTGKELIARCIHYNSCKIGEPFIEVNSGAIPEQLLESELFGHEMGAFTDAKMRKKGLFELANSGTLFLDEIAHLKNDLQAKLLKVIEDKIFRRVGGTKEINVSVRIIAATNTNMDIAVEKGIFREDLYYRLNVVSIIVPPIRDRGMDVIYIANHFIDQFNKEYGMNIKGLSPEAEKLLIEYDWPGNVRELKNVILRAGLLESENVILPEHLNLDTSRKATALKINGNGKISINIPPDGISLEEVEKKLLIAALIETNWNQTQAAKLLHITRDTLRHRIKKHGLKHNPQYLTSRQ